MLRASHLTRRFGDRVAVDDVSFDLPAGEVFALLGPNGAGKTTTLRMLAGLIPPTTGAVRVDQRQGRGRIGLLTEHPGLWDRLTVRANLLVYARLHGLPDPGRAVDTALGRFGLEDRAGDFTAELSKGLKQRVALARTLIHDPGIVLLDEPTSGLDPVSARDVRALIQHMRDEGRAVLLSTHNLDEAERVAERVAVLRTKLVAIDTPAALRARLFERRLLVTLAQDAAGFVAPLTGAGATGVSADGRVLAVGGGLEAPAVVRHLVAAGADIQTVTPDEPRLEEIYLRLVEEETP
jgi:ABC-2 type transport system ATP-binding protein